LEESLKLAYAEDIINALEEIHQEERTPEICLDPKKLAERFLKLRLLGAGRLQKLNPLQVAIDEICNRNGITKEDISLSSIVNSLADAKAVGIFELYSLSNKEKTVVFNAVAADDNPQDKAKEWAARRLATLYDYTGVSIKESLYQESVFVVDGIWGDEDVERLWRGGWTHVCRLGGLEGALNEVFGV
jgi:hypothetical protein